MVEWSEGSWYKNYTNHYFCIAKLYFNFINIYIIHWKHYFVRKVKYQSLAPIKYIADFCWLRRTCIVHDNYISHLGNYYKFNMLYILLILYSPLVFKVLLLTKRVTQNLLLLWIHCDLAKVQALAAMSKLNWYYQVTHMPWKVFVLPLLTIQHNATLGKKFVFN